MLMSALGQKRTSAPCHHLVADRAEALHGVLLAWAPFSFFRGEFWPGVTAPSGLEPPFGSTVSKEKRWKPQMTKTEAYRALAERLGAYAQKPEAADYVAEFKQLAKCYRLLAESAERKAQFDAPRNDLPLSKRRLH
jgi:hypothetical protein